MDRKLKLVPKAQDTSRTGALPPKRASTKAGQRAADAAELKALREQVEAMRTEYEELDGRYQALGALLHAFVLRHGSQVFDPAAVHEQCSIHALRWGQDGKRLVLELAAQPVPPEGKVT